MTAGYDNDLSCKYAYETNNNAKFVHSDIVNVDSSSVSNMFFNDSIRVIIGCAPCQPYSTYSYKYKKDRTRSDPRYDLLNHFSRIVDGVNPEIVSMENVPELFKQNYRQYADFVSMLKSKGYHVFQNIIKCDEYGIPQSRKRLVVIASRLGEISIIPPTHKTKKITVRETISHLEKIESGSESSCDPLHKSSKLSHLNWQRIKATPEGGGWKDWPEHLLLSCHKKDSGKSYPSVYGRMSWDAVAPTITTQSFSLGTGRFGHPEQNRAISLREAALLQTFPESYKFTAPGEKVSFTSIGRHIGNAVPVRLAEVIAISIKNHVRTFMAQQ